MTHDEFYIQKTFDLARKGRSFVSPNPMVGSLIVKDGHILGEGYHKQFGGPHAEVEAIRNCQDSESIAGATLYCNLEPCCHTNKKTPPCTELIIKSQIKRVVIANIDPNPEVAGKGLKILQEHGIEIESGLLYLEGELLNETFFTFMKKKRPFIHAKVAQTLDGQMATIDGHSKWITGEELRLEGHKLRSCHDAIMIGSGTLLHDNPALNVRYHIPHRESPWRIVVGSLESLTFTPQLFEDELRLKTIIFVPENQVKKLTHLNIGGVVGTPFLNNSEKRLDLAFVFHHLYLKGITSVLIEGGPTLITSLMQQRLIDRLSCFIAPKIIGTGKNCFQDLGIKSMDEAISLQQMEMNIISNHFFITGYPTYHISTSTNSIS